MMKMIIILCHLLLAASTVSSKNHGNPANDLVEILNKNRTSEKLSSLNNSPGLGCMALQYINFCKSNCTRNNTLNCNPSEDDFIEVFAPNCGVELPTFGTITGRILACRPKYVDPSLAFSRVLVQDKSSLSLLRNKSHSEVGVGMVRIHKGGSFWCVLFGSGQTKSSFVLENHGNGIKQKKGCFSGSSVPCSKGNSINAAFWNNFISLGFFITCLFAR